MLKTKPWLPSPEDQAASSSSPRRSKRLKEVEEESRRRKSEGAAPNMVDSTSSTSSSKRKKLQPRSGTFPLSTLLSLEVPTRDHLLPLLSPDDWSALELVNRDCLHAIRSKRYWKKAFLEYVENNSLAGKIYRKYLRRGPPMHRSDDVFKQVHHAQKRLNVANSPGSSLSARDNSQGIRSSDVTTSKDSSSSSSSTSSSSSSSPSECPLYYRRLYSKLKTDLQRLKKNVQKGVYKEMSVCLPSDCNSVSTDNTGRVVFAAGENQVDIFGITESISRGKCGATLRLWGHVNWEGKLPGYDDDADDNATHAFLVKNQDDLLFIAHYDGLVTIWNWKDQSLAHIIKRHVQPDNDLDHYYDIPIITAMEVKQDRLIVGLWSAGPVTVWKFEPSLSQPSLATVICEILLHGYGNVHAVDLDAHLAVVAFERSPWNIHHICIWNIEKNAALRFITAPDVKTLCINAEEGGLLASSTRSHATSPVLQLFSLSDGQVLSNFKSVKSDSGDSSEGNVNPAEDFFMQGGACVWTDWKQRIILGFTNGVIAFYDFHREEPLCLIRRRRFGGSYPCWIKDISFDGAYLVFNHETDICLFDFLKLSSHRI